MKPFYLLGLIALTSTASCQAQKGTAAPTDVIKIPMQPTVDAKLRACASKTPSGLGTKILQPATGAKPTQTDIVLVNYIGYLSTTGAVFDQNQQAVFPVSGVVPGFGEGLQTMSKGSIARFCIPAKLGYGPRVAGDIPANSDLVFQVELVDFKSKAEVDAMQREAQGGAVPPPAPPQPGK